MEPRTVPVTTPMMTCDAFTTERFKGNPAGVCLVPTPVYCMEWSAMSSLEASFGRGEPEPLDMHMTEKEREEAGEKYAAERNIKMGRCFQQVAKEMNLSETAFVYRLPASRIRTIQQQIMRKCNEFEHEYEEKVRQDDEVRRRMSAAVTEDDESPAAFTSIAQDQSVSMEGTPAPLNPKRSGDVSGPQTRSPGLLPSSSFSMAYFGASFLDVRGSSIANFGGEKGRRPRRMHTQWFGLRWFTPSKEMKLCGHATFAAAHVICEVSRLCQSENTRHLVANIPMEFFVPAQTDVLCFVTASGIISVRRKSGVTMDGSMSMLKSYNFTPDIYEVHFPMTEAVSVKEQVPPELFQEIADALGLPYGAECVEDIAYSKAAEYYIARLAIPQNVLECRPDSASLQRVFASAHFKAALKAHPDVLGPVQGLGVTSFNDRMLNNGPAADSDVVSRFFAPWVGVDEDPVTGSLYTALTPYWLRLRQKGHFKVGDQLQFYQASKRGGSVTGIVIGRKAERIALVGPVLTFMRGTCIFDVEEEQ
ncbi:hypothetical protein ABB37_07904 [Leptomonas pyrrhocoris]|uniref:Phenazine biosynthesis-like protein n=1 Tax=Leptomonas pyrrhocoris TaxID=157538 RepID=A0A0M9FUC7_LEPPY|nr:hypothetical protein ABB37_07904 [Leptomonas pyrrhocoris]KPA76137.1 hypothetical protein ABB37_07904 [Leptomonas pyrrhocoris]|eukprot:XP_015654576.1 hypothetical protein ABB37_07904 [Leptomonas pyrrhocoris]